LVLFFIPVMFAWIYAIIHSVSSTPGTVVSQPQFLSSAGVNYSCPHV
jgi:hypothetical protein